MGMPLYDKDKKPFDKRQARAVLPNVSGLYYKPYVSGILISHSHKDHYGLVSFSANDIQIYAGQGTRKLMEISTFINGLKIDSSRFWEIKDRQKFNINQFEITPYILDHSAYESMSFLISAEGKNIFYSGDFRAGGSRNWVFEKFIKEYNVKTDALLLEGTLIINRRERDCVSEDDVFEKITKELKKSYKGLTFAAYSSQNIGRFLSFYKSCLKTKKTLVIDPYTALILDRIKTRTIPGPFANNIKIYCVSNNISKKIFKIPGTKKFGKNKIQVNDIISNPEKYVIAARYDIFKKFKLLLKESRLIWSIWDGYLEENKKFWCNFGKQIIKIHTSGHANINTLKEFVKAINPDIIIPIHTQNPELYRNVFPYNKVKLCKNGEEFII